MKKGRFGGQPGPRADVGRTDVLDMDDATLVYLSFGCALWDDVDLCDETEQHGGRS